ncbi:hypothetical protein [Pontibacter cellulosilyticus]|uniref:Lipoprotein n=1 Tax=Pontibacter cellulosilyticus TaxID=1720253 RepID=A0A923N6A9_9BACT|nr:hypothetical protein [Pontibacter cellulosilyticus]MBC5992594.1 hypothetical protein [Pontibacter cellulosilyticus]
MKYFVYPFQIRNPAILFMVFLPLILLMTGCASSRYPGNDGRIPVPYPDEREQRREDKDRDRDWEDRDKDWEKKDRNWERGDRGRGGDGRGLPFRELGIPPGHQPPPQSCASALRSVPLGAWVITHEGSRYRVSIFDRVKRGVVDEVRYYMKQ